MERANRSNLARRLIAGTILGTMLMTSLLVMMTDDARANTGGLDSFGYRWTDSKVPAPTVAYNWIDISTTGTIAWMSGSDDSYSGPYPIGFTFPYYGTSQIQLYISTNGLIMFGSGTSTYSNTQLPNIATPNNIIALYWDDLYVAQASTYGYVYYQTIGSAPDRQMVIEYWLVRPYGGSAQMTFEAVLNENGDIWFQYNTMNGMAGGGATVGIENSAGTIGCQYSYNTASLTNSLAIHFTSTIDFGPSQSSYGQPGDEVSYRLTLSNNQPFTDSFDLSDTSAPGWPVAYYDATGTTLLTDTNGDPNATPDSGDILTGDSVEIVVKVNIPLSPTADTDVAIIYATSFADNATNRTAVLTTYDREPFSFPWLEDFEWGSLGGTTGYNWTTDVPSRADVNTNTYESPLHSMYTSAGPVSVTSWFINLTGQNSVSIRCWVRTDTVWTPSAGENLMLEYLDVNHTWVQLGTYLGGSGAGTVFIRNYSLPASALHSDFQLRFRQIAGSGAFYDYWHIDDVSIMSNTAPVANFAVAPASALAGATFAANASTSNDAEDASSVLMFRWDWDNTGAWTAWSANKTDNHSYSVLGIHTIALQVMDTGGLVSSTTRTVTVNEAPPVTTAAVVGTLGSQGWYTSSVSITLTATDDNSGVNYTEYRADAGTWETYVAPVVISAEGTHSIEYYSTDIAGNTETTKTITVKVDVSPPTLKIWQHKNSTLSYKNVVFNWTCTDSASGIDHYEMVIDGEVFKSLNPGVTLQNLTGTLANGTHHIVLKAFDKSGQNTTVRFDFKVGTPGWSISGGLALMIGLIALAAVGLLVLLFFVAKKRKQQAPPPTMMGPPMPPTPPPAAP